jgi:hypothetical protein
MISHKLHALHPPNMVETYPHYVNSFYRIWFTIIDPTVLFFTVLTCIFNPAMILETVLPPSIGKYDSISHGPLLWQSAALYGFMMVMYAVLLRATSEHVVWRIVQAATLAVDLSLLGVMYALLVQQGRLDVNAWGGGEWFNIGFTVWVALIRIGYLMGIGGQTENAKKRE